MKNGKAVLQGRCDETIESENEIKPSGKELGLLAASVAMEKKAEDPVLLDLQGKSGIADFFLILTGTSDRQVLAITDALVSFLKKRGLRILGVEGENSAQWVLIDIGDLIIHVFHSESRIFYDLEGLWADADRIAIQDDSKGGKEG